MESKASSINFLFLFLIKNQLFTLHFEWFYPRVCDVVPSQTDHLINIDSQRYINFPNGDIFHYTMSEYHNREIF